ncbi:glycoside hydrolase family 16 protein [Paenibacillus sp. TAF58]
MLSNTPTVGVDGDKVVQTFFTISTLKYDNDPTYSELDFEYLPNGGWGVNNNFMQNTSWFTCSNNPPSSDNVETTTRKSYIGWHTLVLVVAGGEIKYYIDGKLLATHTGKYYPRVNMAIDFNHWFVSSGLLSSTGLRSYVEDIDWVYHAKNVSLTTADVNANVSSYRAQNITFVDNVVADPH